jgi:membrane associated rhomboid family serine protease
MGNLSITLILVIITVLISYKAFSDPGAKAQLVFHPASIKNRGEYYRFITSGFIHLDLTHLLVNMFVLWQFGEVVENIFIEAIFGQVWGRIAYILFYLSAIVVASIPTYVRYQDQYGYSALGASGATSALVFIYILLLPWEWFIFPPLPAIILGVAYLWYSSYMDKRGVDNIGHNAHFWGAVYGVAFFVVSCLIFAPHLLDYILSSLMQGPKPPPFFN